MLPALTLSGGSGGQASSGLDQADSMSSESNSSSAGMGDWTVAVGGSGANSGSATSSQAPTASPNVKLAIMGAIAIAALWILEK